MKIKYYLRGLGVGIVITTLILLIVFNTTGKNVSDEEIIARAKELGMVMAEKEEEPVSGKLTETFGKDKDNQTTPAAITDDITTGSAVVDTTTKDAIDSDSKTEDVNTSEDKNEDVVDSDVTTKDAISSDVTTKTAITPSVNTPDAVTTNKVEPNGEKASINIVSGDSSRIVSEKLQAAGIIGDAEDFNKYMKNSGYANMIRVGRFTIDIGEEYKNIAKMLTESKKYLQR